MRIIVEARGTKSVGILILAGLLAALVPSASADTIQYSASGTFPGMFPHSTFSAPNGTWAFSFQADSNPVVPASSVNPGCCFTLPFSNFSYSLNGSPVAITPNFINFFNLTNPLGGGGGWTICFNGSPCSDGLTTIGPQLYTGSESTPTLNLGPFTSTGQAVLVGGNSFGLSHITVTATLVPEPSSLLLLGTGLLGLMGMGLYKKRLA